MNINNNSSTNTDNLCGSCAINSKCAAFQQFGCRYMNSLHSITVLHSRNLAQNENVTSAHIPGPCGLRAALYFIELLPKLKALPADFKYEQGYVEAYHTVPNSYVDLSKVDFGIKDEDLEYKSKNYYNKS